MSKTSVTVFPDCTPVEAEIGSSLFDSLAVLEHIVPNECGGKGICGKCRVQVLKGDTTVSEEERRFLTPDELDQGIRLACRQKVTGETWVALPEGVEIDHTAKLRGFEALAEFPVDAGVEEEAITLPAEPDASFGGLASALPRPALLPALRALARGYAEGHREFVAAIREGVTVAVEPGTARGAGTALAVDIGTTTIAAYLVDLGGGGLLGAAACANSQRRWGSDVVSRIAIAGENSNRLNALQRAVRDDINHLIFEVTRRAEIPRERIYRAFFVGNPTMAHLFLGVDPRSLGMAPYLPASTDAVVFPPSGVRLALPDSCLAQFVPAVSGYVGADSVAAMLAADMDTRPEMTLLLDVGTNGETMLGDRDRLVAGSNAAGPAFEGARIRQGMRASKGAIERVAIDGTVNLKVIGDLPPRGICGSGLIDAVAAMLSAGVVDSTGRILDPDEVPEALRSRILPHDAGNDFVLATPEEGMAEQAVVLTQQDIREVQLAAGAIAAGRKVLCAELGVADEELERVLIAGAFGSYIDPVSAMRIGLLPKVPLDRVKSVGNAAGYGACMTALNRGAEARAAALSRETRYLEFATDPRFQSLFIDCMEFPQE